MWRPGIPIWREGLAALEAAELSRHPPVLRGDPRRGEGAPVLLIPGYLMGDRTLDPLARWLRQLGFAPEHAAIAANVDCVTRTAGRLGERLRAITERHDEPAFLVGHSLGGVIGRLLALRHPDLVRGVVCLGSPLTQVTAVHPLVSANVRLLTALGDLGVPGLLSRECLGGACCADSRRLLQAPFPGDVGFVSVYSRTDGIVDWRACLDPWAEHVEVASTHIGMPVNAAVHRLVADRLAGMVPARGVLRLAA